MPVIPVFPLGSVLLPHMPLPLRLFEQRYLTMLAEVLGSDIPAFGVVLIERGQEVGGGDQRFTLGTIAEIVEVAADEGSVTLDTVGAERFEVVSWLPEDPYPRAEVRILDALDWDDSLLPARDRAEAAVRTSLAVASEFSEQRYASVIELSDDPVARCWQIAGIAPVGELDQLALLRASSLAELLERATVAAEEATESFRAGW